MGVFSRYLHYILGLCLAAVFFVSLPVAALSFKNDFAGPLLDGDDAAYDIGIKDTDNLLTNMKRVFYPDTSGDNTVWNFVRTIAVGVFVVLLIWAGFYFVMWAPDNEEDLHAARMNILYLIIGAFILFGGIWILGTALDLGSVEGLAGGENSLVARTENNVVLVIISFLKGAAFFAAIVFLVVYGYKMMQSFDEEEKLKAARTGILNVFLALLLIKIIDFVYFIAQVEDFKNQAIELIVQISKFLGYVGGIIFVIAIFYVGFLMLTAKGDDENIEKAKGMLQSIFIIILIIMLFMLVVFQVFQDLL